MFRHRPLGHALVVGVTIALIASVVGVATHSAALGTIALAGLLVLLLIGLYLTQHRQPFQHLRGTRVLWRSAQGDLLTGTVVGLNDYFAAPRCLTVQADDPPSLVAVPLVCARFPLKARIRHSWRCEKLP